MSVELERKFLLKSLPNVDGWEFKKVHHYYDEKGIRFTQDTYNNGKSTYRMCIKQDTGQMVARFEEETILNKASFLSVVFNQTTKFKTVRKERYEKTINDIEVCIDVFKNINIVMMEIEKVLDDIEYFELCEKGYDLNTVLPFPEQFKDYLIMEVTHFPEFRNPNLAVFEKTK